MGLLPILLSEGLVTVLAVLVGLYLIVRYVPPARRFWLQINTRRIKTRMQYHCKTHGDMHVLDVVWLEDHPACPVCNHHLLQEELR
jgi:hypothetical protein